MEPSQRKFNFNISHQVVHLYDIVWWHVIYKLLTLIRILELIGWPYSEQLFIPMKASLRALLQVMLSLGAEAAEVPLIGFFHNLYWQVVSFLLGHYGISKKISEIIRLIGFSVVFLPKLTNPYVGGVSPKKEPLKKKNEGQLYYPGVLREGLWYWAVYNLLHLISLLFVTGRLHCVSCRAWIARYASFLYDRLNL